jgi:hypothetical protein
MKKLSLILLMLCTACNFSEGDRVGQVVKLSKKGFIFKTYEGELATIAKGTQATLMSNSFAFSITDESLVKKVQEAINSNKTVALHYEEQYFSFWWEGDTRYHITSVNVTE